MTNLLRTSVVFLLLIPPTFAQEKTQAVAMTKRAMTVDDLFAFQRVGAPTLSPDGTGVCYASSEITDAKNNKSVSRLWLVPTDGSLPARQLTNPAAKDMNPKWSPDGRWILFESTRSGSLQLWAISPFGGEARQLTSLSTGAGTAVWAPNSRHIAFVSAVYPEFSALPFKESDAKNKAKADEIEASPVKARVFKKLFYRHWDSYVEDKRQHLFVIDLTEETPGELKAGEPRDVTPGDRDSYPTSTTFSGTQDFAFSPDGSHLIFTAVPKENEAWNTNYDLCRVPVTGGTTEWETLTTKSSAADGLPTFSPAGNKIAFRSQRKPGYEADKWEVMIASCNPDGSLTSDPVSLTSQIDLSFDEILWRNDGQLIVTAEQKGSKPVFGLAINKPNELEKTQSTGTCANLSLSADGQILICNNSRMTFPNEVFSTFLEKDVMASKTPGLNLSRANAKLLEQLDLAEPTSVSVKGADGDPMQMWVVTPPGFDKTKKWPLAYLVHGGPQGAWMDGWSFRWNPMIWAAQGYVVAAPNPRGSTGFGQRYTDQISGDWGGRCYIDLMAGLEFLEQQSFVDTDRMFSAGASFGGYMMNWFQGHTTKFKTLVTHCGVYNFESMYTTTEELWFDEYEHGGPPWGPNRESYERHSPHRYAANFKTPMLIIHNDLDFRVPVSEGQQLFTALQRQGIPSKFINFPDEGHWVLKPANSHYWHSEIFSWLKEYCPPGPR
ncbi:MAG: S9 family peptidase [Planctomycetaceae bacterium]|nr:S9 family peptidase [Planctomycetaceae bacterium]